MRSKIFIASVIAAVAMILGGCASLPSTEAMKSATAGYQLPHKPADGKAMVYVVRPSSLGGLIRFNVFVDDQEDASEMGYTRASQYIHFSVAPGEHKIYSKAENWAETNINAKAGDIFFIQQEPEMGILMARNELYKLEELTGKYYVKTLSVGTIIKTGK